MKRKLLPKVSVVVPTYNSSDTIIACINSILLQDYEGEIEVIIIDDGSIDSTSNLIKSNFGDVSNVKYFYKANGGVSSARNFGIKLCDCDFIAFCDSDDSWESHKLKSQISLMIDNSIDFLGSVLQVKGTFYLKKVTLTMMLFKNYFQPSTVIFKHSIISSAGYFDESQRYAEEGNYFYKILHGGFNCFLLNEKLTSYGDGKLGFGVSGLSANLYQMQLGELKNLKFAYKKLNVSLFLYLIAVTFSVIKFCRRILIVKFKKLCHI